MALAHEFHLDLVPGYVSEEAERAARASLRAQICKLEHQLSDMFVTAFTMGGLELPEYVPSQPRMLNLGELEVVRDALAERLHAARLRIADRADAYEANRQRLERMLLEPGKYRYQKVALAEIGQPGCGEWQSVPRLGLIGMLAGWWHVKLSSGCPLARGRGTAPRPAPL
jgi:hypothetical protein